MRGLDGRLRGLVRLRVCRRPGLRSRFLSALASADPTYIEADGVRDWQICPGFSAQLPFKTRPIRGEGSISGRDAWWCFSMLIVGGMS